MRHIVYTVALFLFAIASSGQVGPFKYFVEFTDKNGTPYNINQPQAFLTQRAIDRRNSQYITVTTEDLPVNPSYVNQVRALCDQVMTTSKWFNGITILLWDSTKLQDIAALPFVLKIDKTPGGGKVHPAAVNKFQKESSFLTAVHSASAAMKSSTSYNYGPSYHQIHMLNGDLLHDLGFRGDNKVIAVLDAGFLEVDVLKAFDSLRAKNQILGTKDFVNPGGNVYMEHIHGMMVLSLMGGNYPGEIVGTAPKASFWLLRSEDANTEYIIEEYNWVSAAEFADSVGADVISSSLGYTTFDDPSMNHTCADMNGHTVPASRGANIAATKGMAVVVSAGNEGGNPNWRCLSSPGEADNVLGIGAVDSAGNYASFSSVGIVSGSRVKPNVAAMGENDVVFWVSDSIVTGSGTSFSCPITAGLTACLWQARPDVTPARLYDAIEESANRYSNPDSLTGYGIPDFSKALNILSLPVKEIYVIEVFPNPLKDQLTVRFHNNSSNEVRISIYDITGKNIKDNFYRDLRVGENILQVKNLTSLTAGLYLLKLTTNTNSVTYRLIKM